MWVPQVTSWVVTLTPEHGEAPISKGLVRESLNRKVLPITPIQAYLTENLSCTQSYILYNYHTSRVTHASLLLRVGLLHVGLLHVGRHYYWRWDNIGPTYIYISQTKYRKHITLTPWVQNPVTQSRLSVARTWGILLLLDMFCEAAQCG